MKSCFVFYDGVRGRGRRGRRSDKGSVRREERDWVVRGDVGRES